MHQKTIEWLQQIDRFFKTTHDYRTQVDLVLYNPNWRQWCERAKLPEYDTIDEFAANVVKVLAPSDRRATAWPRRKTTKLDGLTIDLNGFDDENWPYGIKLIKEIRENLQKTGHKYYLNLIIPGHEIKDIVDVLRHLERIIPEDAQIREFDLAGKPTTALGKDNGALQAAFAIFENILNS